MLFVRIMYLIKVVMICWENFERENKV